MLEKISPRLSCLFNIVIIDDKVIKNRGGSKYDLSYKDLINNMMHFNKVLIDNNNNLDVYIQEEDLYVIKPRLEQFKESYDTIIIYTPKNIITLK